MRQRTIQDKVFFIMTKLKYKTTAINNRRYLGNKYRLLLFITQTIFNAFTLQDKEFQKHPKSLTEEI